MRHSPVKKHLIEKQNAISNLLEQYAMEIPETNFIDIRTVMYEDTGRLRKDIFMEDSLHLNNTGNELLINVIKPVLVKQLGKFNNTQDRN